MNVTKDSKIILTLSEVEARLLAKACLEYSRIHNKGTFSTDSKVSDMAIEVWDKVDDAT